MSTSTRKKSRQSKKPDKHARKPARPSKPAPVNGWYISDSDKMDFVVLRNGKPTSDGNSLNDPTIIYPTRVSAYTAAAELELESFKVRPAVVTVPGPQGQLGTIAPVETERTPIGYVIRHDDGSIDQVTMDLAEKKDTFGLLFHSPAQAHAQAYADGVTEPYTVQPVYVRD